LLGRKRHWLDRMSWTTSSTSFGCPCNYILTFVVQNKVVWLPTWGLLWPPCIKFWWGYQHILPHSYIRWCTLPTNTPWTWWSLGKEQWWWHLWICCLCLRSCL
jgi:hypothetical protein